MRFRNATNHRTAARAALFAGLLALAAFAQQPAQHGMISEQSNSYTDGVIVVQVSDSRGKPLPGALVALSGNTSPGPPQPISRNAASDAFGRARFSDLPNGFYSADAAMAGRIPAAEAVTNQTQLQGAAAQARFQLKLRRQPVLTGRVVDETGAPLPYAQVHVFRMTRYEGALGLASAAIEGTDDRGVYRARLSLPGRYWVMAYHVEPSFPRGSAPRSTGVVFYPNSPDLLSAQSADLAFDQPETTLDIALPAASRTELVAGILSGPDSRPCTRCGYSVQRVEGPFQYPVTNGGTGRNAGFDTRGIPPGQYRIYVRDDALNPGWWAIEETSVVENRTAALTIQTQPPVAVAGRVTLQDLPPQVREQDRDKTDAVIVQLNQVGNHFFSPRNPANGQAALPLDPSEFTLGSLPPEKFRLDVTVQGADSYIAAIKRQGRKLPSPVFDLSQPADWTNLEIQVRFDLAQPQFRIPATAAAGVQEPAYRLHLVPHPEDNPFGRITQGQCVPDGSCYAPQLPPGRYWAIVMQGEDSEPPDAHDPEMREKLDRWGRDLTLTPGENPTIELTLAPDKMTAR
jgi:hypothetical protein